MTVINNNYINTDLKPINQLVQNSLQSEEPANDSLNIISNFVSSGAAGAFGAYKATRNPGNFQDIPKLINPENFRRINGMISFDIKNNPVIDNYNNLAKASPEIVSRYESMAGRSPNLMSDLNFSDNHAVELENAHVNTIKNYQDLESRFPNDPNIKVLKDYEILKYNEAYGSKSRRAEVESLPVPQNRERISMGDMARSVGGSAVQGAKYGAIFGGLVSGLVNGYQVITGQKTGNEAVGTFIADTAGATISGAAGAALGGLTFMGLSAMGMASLPITILTAGVGLIGSLGANFAFQKTGIYDAIKNLIK
jgi:hypothetical protein